VADRVLVAVPGLGVLVLTPEVFRTALAEGEQFSLTPVTAARYAAAKLVSAQEMEAATGVPASWFASQARERRIPFRKLGRYVRFNPEEVMACEALQRRAVAPGQLCTGLQNRKGHLSA
jgi:hypothetical protein